MARLNISWVLPTLRESGKPLDPTHIANVLIEISADGISFESLGTFAKDTLSTFVDDIDYGEWFVRGTVYDTSGRASDPAVVSITRADETPPGALAITLSLS